MLLPENQLKTIEAKLIKTCLENYFKTRQLYADHEVGDQADIRLKMLLMCGDFNLNHRDKAIREVANIMKSNICGFKPAYTYQTIASLILRGTDTVRNIACNTQVREYATVNR